MTRLIHAMIIALTGASIYFALPVYAGKVAQPSLHEEEIAKRIGFDRRVLLIAKEAAEDGHVHRLSGYEEGGYQIMTDGLSISVPLDKSKAVLSELRKKLRPVKYAAFIVEENEQVNTARIGIIRDTDRYEILRMMQTNGLGYEISTQDIIDRLKDWEKCSEFDIVGAGNDWLELEFKRLPQDIKSFVQEVQDFCPDAADEGLVGLEELREDLMKNRRLYLYWE